MGFYKIAYGEKVLAIKQPSSPADDFLDLDHRVDRPHQNNVANIAGIHSGGKFLRCGQYGWYGFFVVLKIPKMLITQYTIIGSNPLAIVRVFAIGNLIDKVSNN